MSSEFTAELSSLRQLFREYPYIAAAYLFGSHARGKAGPVSDVDIAILLEDNAPAGSKLIHEEDYLAYRIGKALGVKEVDLMHLNSKGLVFQHNVLASGRLIYDGDPACRIRFEAGLISQYCDFAPTIRFMERFHIQGIIERCGRL